MGRLDPYPPCRVIRRPLQVPKKVSGLKVSTLPESQNVSEEDILTFIRDVQKRFRSSMRRKKTHQFCLCCNAPVSRRHTYCSQRCSNKAARKVKRPSKKKLKKLVWKYPTTKIAKHYGVSDQAVAKWCKSYGIEKPPRGYWTKKRVGKV